MARAARNYRARRANCIWRFPVIATLALRYTVNKLKIEYIHGFASSFDTKSDKVSTLSQIGDVTGFSYDYTQTYSEIVSQLRDSIRSRKDIDVIVGTSLGGYFAAALGCIFGIPFASINPAVDPRSSLLKYCGDGTSWDGRKYNLRKEVVETYPEFSTSGGCGVILLDLGDEVIDSLETAKLLTPFYRIVTFEGGTHRFAHMQESLQHIQHTVSIAEVVYGFGDGE